MCVCPGGEVPVSQHSGTQQRQVALSTERQEVQGELRCVCVCEHGVVTVVTLTVFQAPEFVRKHILNKHGDKVAAVRQEVEFFNNFLLDAKRPALPENKPLPPPAQGN